jgi:hypothetical protein
MFCSVFANVDFSTHALLRTAPNVTCLDVLRLKVLCPELLDPQCAPPQGVSP